MSGIYEFEFTGRSPLILHADNIEYAERLDAWRKDPANRNLQVKGDDRSPAWTWISYLYISEGRLAMPSDNLATCLRDAGASFSLPGGRSGKTCKSITQSGMIFFEESFPLLIDGKPVEKVSQILDLEGNNDFSAHQSTAAKMGFELYMKRARLPGKESKHVRVRPRLHRWSVKGSVHVTEEALGEDLLGGILDFAGKRIGLCDWRPSAKKGPGPYGCFNAGLKKVG